MTSGATQDGFHGYTPVEMEAAIAITRSEDPRWRWLFPVTRTSRDFLRSQFVLLNGSYAVAVTIIFLAAQADEVASARLIEWWLAESVVSIAVRNLLYVPIIKAAPAEVAGRPLLRLLPLGAVILGIAHWAITAWIFVGPTQQLTIVVLMVFVMLSMASIAIAPASPASCLLYLAGMWSVMLHQLSHAHWLSGGTLTALLCALAGILWLTYHIVVTSSRHYLVQSDETELLVRNLRLSNAEVERLRSGAADELQTRSAFFASASHDFRQRVHALKLLAMPRASSSDAVPVMQAAMVRITEVTEELEDYMTHILEFARLDDRTIKPVIRSVRLQDLFQRLELRFEDIAAERQADLRVRATDVVLRTDPAILERILENVVSNAVKFTRDRVLLGVRRSRSGFAIDVRDRGPGIANDALERVFEAFYQAHDGQFEARRGVGLGLAIVKRLADSLGYEVRVSSTPGAGTLVRILIPNATQKEP